MYRRTVIFLVLVMFLSTKADNQHDICNKTSIGNAIKGIRAHIQKLHKPDIQTGTILDKIEASFKVFVDKYELFMSNCTTEEKQNLDEVVDFFENITSINLCVMSMVKGEMEEAKEAIQRVTDEQLMELMVTVYCSNETDCRKMLNFANDLPNARVSTLIYRSLTHLLDYDRMNTTMEFINVLHKAKKGQTNEAKKTAMQRLLRQAIKADLTLEYDNIDVLYKMDSDLTYEAVQELISDNFDGNIESYAIFHMVQRSPNATIWIRNLEKILHKLKEGRKVNSIFGAELVREIKRIEDKHKNLKEVDQETLQTLKDGIPTFVEKLLLGEICCDMAIINNVAPEESTETKIYLSSRYDGEFKRVKFVPNESGSLVVLDVKIEGSNMTLVMDHFEHDGNVLWNGVIAAAKNAEIDVLTDEEFCKIEKHDLLVCMPAQFILSTITKSPYGDSTLIEKFFEYYHTNKNTCSKMK